MKKINFLSLGAALVLASGLMFTACSDPNVGGVEKSAEMIVKFTFEDFTVDTFKVTAYNGINVDDGSETVNATVAEDGKSASCTVTNTYANDSGWLTLQVEAVKDGTTLSIEYEKDSVGNTGPWFEFVEDGEITISYKLHQTTEGLTQISSDTITITAEGTYQLAVNYDDIKDYSTVYITLAEITAWGEGTYGLPCLGTDASTWKANTAWVDAGAFTDSNVSSTTGGYFATISPADYTGGVYITGKTGLAGTLFVSGSNDSSSSESSSSEE